MQNPQTALAQFLDKYQIPPDQFLTLAIEAIGQHADMLEASRELAAALDCPDEAAAWYDVAALLMAQ